MSEGLLPGAVHAFNYVTRAEDTAAALTPLTGDAFPAVLSTTRTIALLELAAGRLLVPLLAPGQLSVGVGVEVKHLAATAVGAWVEAQATYTGREGKLYRFEVLARDAGGEIMRGVHTRAVIDEARLLEGARKRGG